MNPFILKDYAGPDLFCNRKKETSRLINAIENQRNLTLSSIRKMGKTGLIYHVFDQLNRTGKIETVYVDIYYTNSLPGFINTFGTSLFSREESLPAKIRRKMTSFIKNIRPTITYDSLTGSPVFSFRLENEQESARTLDEIFRFLHEISQDKPVVIAIDEFQQIDGYPEQNVEALLRTNIQKLRNVSFIFSGSDQRLLGSMFNDVKRPFYQSTEFMHLEAIGEDDYFLFIKNNFGTGNIRIEDEAIHEILMQTRCHTYYVQFLCNRLYGSGIQTVTPEDVKHVYADLLKENEVFYSGYRDLLTRQQWNLLKALAKEEGIAQVSSSAFIKKHDLTNAATVRRGIQSLLEKNMIYKKDLKYFVYDVFFAKWLKRMDRD